MYKYYRDSIIRHFRRNPSKKITFTEARRGIVGDVGSIRRVFDFLEAWGLINYVPSTKPSSKEKREAVETSEKKESPKKLCSSCKSVLSLACFMTDKSDIVLCARCYVRGNYRPGLSTSDFKRVDISEETRTDWTDKETLHLLEAIFHYGEDWKKVAQHVGTRTEKDCVARFIKLPFGEQFMSPLEDREDSMQNQKNDKVDARSSGENVIEANQLKRRRLTPLADASNPIMAQVAFLSAMVGSEVARAAAQAAIAALDKVNMASINIPNGMEIRFSENGQKGEAYVANGPTPELLKEAAAEAESQLKKEQRDEEQFITEIVQAQMKEIQEKIEKFEEVELQMEKEWLQLRHMKDLFFADQLALVQHTAPSSSTSPENGGIEMKTNDDVT